MDSLTEAGRAHWHPSGAGRPELGESWARRSPLARSEASRGAEAAHRASRRWPAARLQRAARSVTVSSEGSGGSQPCLHDTHVGDLNLSLSTRTRTSGTISCATVHPRHLSINRVGHPANYSDRSHLIIGQPGSKESQVHNSPQLMKPFRCARLRCRALWRPFLSVHVPLCIPGLEGGEKGAALLVGETGQA